ncbi:Zinc transporter ZIP9 [Colletotrichum orbiculare MAFF 240422]|uniref:Zinc transporter ZIP9 n=1 Tax=Colletotrichum orbiculare (strain 104-T / ATCC 96160 / CBS 514.97 / LARS 414 / MAFF 240422) TaxID=1213857 RepID=A0A484FZF2_COLOR|nr:Zinc transporter ZIP9 [Colletotrichum orbiculare MAFF 240422]
MGGLLLLLLLSTVMALASFFAGSLPLAITLTQSQLRFISSVGVGILVGTSMIVIIPEGIEAVTTRGEHQHGKRSMANAARAPGGANIRVDAGPVLRRDEAALEEGHGHGHDQVASQGPDNESQHGEEGHGEVPTFYIGLSMILGFVLMFLIDRLPRHATGRQTEPQMRHVSLDNLGGAPSAGDEESEGFLGSLAPPPKQSRSLATTIGLVIHAAADGIAMGASTSTSNTKLGLIIFVAIMVHKAPAAFGLTSVLLKQGLTKRTARGHLIVFSLAAPVGALSTWAIIQILGGGNLDGESGQWWTGMLLLFSAGTFLFVAMHAMQEESSSPKHEHGGTNGYSEGAAQRGQQRPQIRDTLATVAGMLLPLLTQFGHHH